jgi:hypothetical protein
MRATLRSKIRNAFDSDQGTQMLRERRLLLRASSDRSEDFHSGPDNLI